MDERIRDIDNLLDTGRCIGYCDDKYIGKYFAISGVNNEKERRKLVPLIKSVLGNDCDECGAEETFYCFHYLMNPSSLNILTSMFYENLCNVRGREYLINFGPLTMIPFDPDENKKYLYSCVERKIIGHWFRIRKNSTMPTIYVSKKPCYLCLPAIKRVYYLNEDNKIFGIKKTFQISSICGYREIDP